MAYSRTTWKDQIVTDPTKYRIINQDGTEEIVNIEREPGEIIQEGTKITAARLNNIEQGISDNVDGIDVLSAQMADLTDDVNAHLADYATETEYGHVIVDGKTIQSNNGSISAKVEEVIKEFNVASGNEVGVGNLVSFIEGGIKKAGTYSNSFQYTLPEVIYGRSTYITGCKVRSDEDAFLIAFWDGDGGNGIAFVVTMSGNFINVVGTSIVFNSGTTTNIYVEYVEDNKVLITYNKGGTNNPQYARILTINNTTITAHTPLYLGYVNDSQYSADLKIINNTKAIFCFADKNSSDTSAFIINISGETLTKGTTVVIDTSGDYYIACSIISEDKILLIYRISGGAKAKLLEIDGDSITVLPNDLTLNLGTSLSVNRSLVKLDSERFLLLHDSSSLDGLVIKVENDVITQGDKVIISNDLNETAVYGFLVGDNRVIALTFNTSTYEAIYYYLNIDGMSINPDKGVYSDSFGYSYISSINALILDSGKILFFMNGSDNNTRSITIYPENKIILDSFVGIAKENKVGGEICKVSLGPVTTGLSLLETGKLYYLDSNSGISTNKSDVLVGVAVSETELIQTIRNL